MKTKRSAQGRESAREQLIAIVDDYRSRGILRLPSLQQLATLLGVSRVTVWKAVGDLKLAGVLEVINRGGIILTGTAPSRQVPVDTPRLVPRVERWKQVADDLSNDLLGGKFDPDKQLPTVKELAIGYGSSFRTIRKALGYLAESGRIAGYKKGYRVPVAHQSSRASVVIIARTRLLTHLLTMHPYAAGLFGSLHQQCLRHNLGQELIDYSEATGLERWPDTRFLPVDRMVDQMSVMGFVVLVKGMTHTERERMLPLLSASRKPVSFYLETPADQEFCQWISSHPHWKAFMLPSSYEAGKTLGLNALHKGYRSVAWFSVGRKDLYVCQRLAGLRDAYAQGGFANAIDLFGPEHIEHYDDLHRLIREQEPYRDLSGALERFEEIAVHDDPHQEGLFRIQSQGPVRVLFVNSLMVPEFTKALKQKKYDLWVCCTDEFGILAYRYLKKQGVKIPGTIGLMAFDDIIETFLIGMTSYNFNIGALGTALIDFIINRKPFSATGPIVTIPGYIMERSTTARQ